jgi:GT2 family glycosyltransferase
MASVVRLVRSAENLGFSLAVNLLAERTGVSLDRAANPHIRLEPKALSLC